MNRRTAATHSIWPDTVDEIFEGDCVVLLAYVTPAAGVLLTPVMNFRVRDRARGTLTVVNSSVGVWKKLERIRRNPRVALALHTRRHGANCRAECVLVQGKASLSETVADYPAVYSAAWEPIAINTCQRTDRHLARRPSRRHALGAKASPAPKPCDSGTAERPLRGVVSTGSCRPAAANVFGTAVIRAAGARRS